MNFKKNNVAIIQIEGFHEEVLPSCIYYLNALGISPSVFVNVLCEKRGNIFNSLYGELDFSINYLPLESENDLNKLKKILLSEKFEVLLATTFQRDKVGELVSQVGLPFIGIVHNPKIFFQQEKCIKALNQLPSTLLTLGRHVTAFMILHKREFFGRVRTISGGYWGSLDVADIKIDLGKKIFAVPGYVSFRNRNYSLLLDISKELKKDTNYKNIMFYILGGGNDRKKLEHQFKKSGNAEHIQFAKVDPETGFVKYDEYIMRLRESHFLLPLFPNELGDYRNYKISSVITTALGFGIPVLQDHWTEEVYRLPNPPYADSLSLSVSKAMALNNDDYMALRIKYGELRLDELRRSIHEFSKSLNSIGLKTKY